MPDFKLMANLFYNHSPLTPMKKLVIAFLLIALVTRLYMLDDRPMDHDESIHGYLSYILMKDHSYSYDPAYHGPFLYFATAGVFSVLGDSKFTARLVPVVFSIIGIFFALRFERFYKNSYLFAAILLFSPSILYYSRYLRNDVIVLASFIAVVYSYFSYRQTGRARYIYIASIFAAVMVTAKENGYLYLGTILSFIFFRKLHDRDYGVSMSTLKHLLVSFLIAFFMFSFLYTSAFSDMDGLKRATINSFAHWFEMHERNDHWKPIYYYSKMILEYEFLPLGMVLAGIPEFVRRVKGKELTEIELFAFYWLATAFLIYHVLSHKVPWLLVHLVAPMAFFGSLYAGYLTRKPARFVFVSLLLITAGVAGYLAYVDSTNTDHDLIYIQAQRDVEKLADRIIEYNGSVLVFVPGNDYWPLPWYLRHHSTAFSSKYYDGYDVVVTSKDQVEFVKEKGYVLDGVYTLRPGHDLYWLHKA
ncbi:TIGR03663 family protein [Geoglobus ahangari]|uniref:TIGR03663 family protein n=2 Tax=Geoglobus ahangari TaxID=113653 RepID=A0A0F7IEL7_9EURY|nr:TIGR03663 family protein [Geoglobus ahangari]